MTKVGTSLIAALALLACSFAAHADCVFPKAPATIPDGKTASEQDMVTAMAAFKAYNEEVTKFGSCLEDETKSKSAGTGQLMQLKTMQTKKLNAAVSRRASAARNASRPNRSRQCIACCCASTVSTASNAECARHTTSARRPAAADVTASAQMPLRHAAAVFHT
jgi:hypothetical protein